MVTTRLRVGACCGVERQRQRGTAGLLVWRCFGWSGTVLFGMLALVVDLMGSRTSLELTGALVFYNGITLLLLWLTNFAPAQVLGLLRFIRLRQRGVVGQKHVVYPDGISDAPLAVGELPRSFAAYVRLDEDRRYFYLWDGEAYAVFEKSGFTKGAAGTFRVFMRRALAEAAAEIPFEEMQ